MRDSSETPVLVKSEEKQLSRFRHALLKNDRPYDSLPFQGIAAVSAAATTRLSLGLEQAMRALKAIAEGRIPEGMSADIFAAQAVTRVEKSLLGSEFDNCDVCFGESGGVRGNENLIDGVRTCDYCHCKKGLWPSAPVSK